MKLNHKPQLWPATLLVFGLFVFLASCSKDKDLLSDYVINEENLDFASNIIIDDYYTVLYGSHEIFDVLGNDNFNDSLTTIITAVSNPIHGTVTLKEDNTLVYYAPGTSAEELETSETPSEESNSDHETDEESDGSNTSEEQQNEEFEVIEDTFTYTTETEDEDGEITTETGTVNIVIENPESNSSDEISTGNYLFTSQAKALLKERFKNGYIAGPGFNNDVDQVLSTTQTFINNPSQNRPEFGDINGEVNRYGHYLHTTAVYAYATDSITIANTVANEILEIVKSNNLYSDYWNKSNTIRWDSTNDHLWEQCSKAKKIKDSYYFIKNIQTVLTNSEKTVVESWFKRFAELSFQGVKNRIDGYFGEGWDADNFTSKYYTGDLFEGEEPNPIQDINGNDLYLMALPQDVYNNRHWDILGYVHSWAVSNNDLEKEIYCRNFFKVFLKYGVFPDGTCWEAKRNRADVPTVGIGYGWLSTGAAILMAHIDAMANHFPTDKLYDFKTTEGVLYGSTTISDTPYKGTSTTDGVTEKSLLLLIKAQSNYLRSKANGGWNDIRYYRTTPLNTEGLEQPSSVPAMANLYYKDTDLFDLYTYNTAVGYPPKQNISGGYMAGVWDKDSGGWGNMIFGSMWYGQENNFFN